MIADMGAYCERAAADYLRKKWHYKLYDFNFRTRYGELDLIFTYKRKTLVFVEVKARDVNSIAPPREFVDTAKQQRLIKAAQFFMRYYHLDLQPRFDVVEVLYEKETIKSIHHLENAFTFD